MTEVLPMVRRVPGAILPWLFPAAALVAGLVATDTPGPDIARYAVYLAVAVVLPGTLVFRALVGSRGNLPEDLGLGAATGLVTMLLGWAVAAATGRQTLLPGWPLLIIALFLAVPGLRRHWRVRDPRPLPLRWSWLLAGGLLVVVLMGLRFWAVTPLPGTSAVSYYQDLLYHLSLVHEMTRSMPFQVPQLAGDTLRYHYLADADMATASMLTGIPPATVLMRLWAGPVIGVTMLVVAALGRDLTGKWWAGALAGVASIVAMPLTLGAVTNGFASDPVINESPSQTYALPLFGLLVVLAVQVLRGRSLRWGWLLVLPVALACAGAKSSVLPPFVAGLVLAVVAVAWRDRARLRATLALLGLTLAAMLTGLKIFAGAGAGTLGFQPLALLYLFLPYRQTVGAEDTIDGSLALPHGVAHASAQGIVFLVGLILWWALIHANHLLGLVSLRPDPVRWLLAGMTLAGTGAAWLLWHPSASQGYFYLGIIPFATLLTVWFVADRVRGWRPVVAGLVAGLIWALVAPRVAGPADPSFRTWTWALGLPLLRTAAVAVVVAGLGWLIWRASRRAFVVAALAAMLGAALGSGVGDHARGSWAAVHDGPRAGYPASEITADEVGAAAWLDRHAGPDDLVATNVHCVMITWRSTCDARAFWVGGLGGRRTLLESWGYSDPVFAHDGVNGLRYYRQPAPDPEVYALNQRVFREGRQADVARLRDGYRVRWLFGDRRVPGGVSPRLARVAAERYTAGPVTVYELT